MAQKFTEQEREERINMVGNYFLSEEHPSIRKCMEYFKQKNISISVPTVKSYLDLYKKMYPKCADILNEKIDNNKPKSIEDDEVRNRVLIVAQEYLNGKDLESIAQEYTITKDTLYRDITERLPKISENLAKQVSQKMKMNKLNNLMHGNDAYMTQSRDENGKFTK